MKSLFRGFCRNENGKETIYLNGEAVKGDWLYGYHAKFRNFADKILSAIIPVCEETGEGCMSDLRAVIPETVCEAVRGFIDVNGNQVFRGDIVKNIHSETIGEVIYTNEFAYKIKKQDGYDIWIGANDYYIWKVIGTNWDKENENE